MTVKTILNMNLFNESVKLNQSASTIEKATTTTSKIEINSLESKDNINNNDKENNKLGLQIKSNNNNKLKMQNRSRLINKLALVLLSIVLLELVLIGDQVQPVKAIKKKIFIKKLKKLLPLLAIVKPKKKIILLPIPVPMFKNHGQYQNNYNHQRPMMIDASAPPMSFMMMTTSPSNMQNNQNGLLPFDNSFLDNSGNGVGQGFVGISSPMTGDNNSGRFPITMSMLPMTMANSNNNNMVDLTPPIMAIVNSQLPTSTTSNKNITTTSTSNNNNNNNVVVVNDTQQASAGSPQNQIPMAMLMPTMTMTIQSEPGGNSAIELSTNMVNPLNSTSTSGMLGNLQQQRPQSYYHKKWSNQLQHQQQLNDNFDDPWPVNNNNLNDQQPGGEQYYSSPWQSKQPLVSPAKVFRNEKLKQQNQQQLLQKQQKQQQQQNTQQPSQFQQVTGRLQQQQQPSVMPILVIKNNNWKPTIGNNQARDSNNQHQQQQQQQQQSNNLPLEYEELIPVGPPQMMPVYQTPNGQLHMSPPRQSSPPPPPQQQQQQHQQQPNNSAENRVENQQQSFGSANMNINENRDQQSSPLPSSGLASSALEHEELSPGNFRSEINENSNNEVQTIGVQLLNNQNFRQQQQTFKPNGASNNQRLTSPAVKGKQQQQQLQKPISGNRTSSGVY